MIAAYRTRTIGTQSLNYSLSTYTIYIHDVSQFLSSSQGIRNTKTRRPCRYQKVNETTRNRLIQLVCAEGNSLRQAASEANVKYSTAKAIIQVYQSEGRVGKKSTRDKRVYTKMQTFFIMINKSTGKISKLRVESESNDLMRNYHDVQKGLTDKHYDEASSVLSTFLDNYKRQLNIKEEYTQRSTQFDKLQQILSKQHSMFKQ